jgi:autotransporter-associated beta strand protein
VSGQIGGLGGSIIKDGTGTLTLADANAFSGGTTLEAGTLELAAPGAAGSGTITFAADAIATLQVDNAAFSTETFPKTLSNAIYGFVSGDIVDLAGVSYDKNGTATLGPGNVLQIVENNQTYKLDFDPTQVFGGGQFELSPDGSVGTDVTFVAGPPSALTASGTTVSGTEGTAISGATVATFTDANPSATASDFTATINWGDGTTTSGTVVAQNGGGFAVDGDHSYADEGTYTIGVTINDVGGSTTSATSTADIREVSVEGIVASPIGGDLNTGAIITLTLKMSEIVTVTGTPELMLNDGGTAIYKSGSGSDTLIFTYTVANAQNTSTLSVVGNNLNGSTIAITDTSGDEVDFSGADVGFPGLAIGATVQSIIANPSTGDLGPGKTVSFTVTMSEPVKIIGGKPFLMLNNGGEAIYKSGSGTNVLTFSYTVGALGSVQNAASLAVTGFNPNGAIVYHSNISADTADLSGVTTFTSGPQIDTTAPTVTSVTATPATADFDAGKTVVLTVMFSEMVTVTGTPYLSLNDGGKANYTAGSGTDALTFTYVVTSGQNTSDLAVNRLALNGGTIKDDARNNAVLSRAAGGLSGILQIDTVAPKIRSIVASGPGITAGNGDLGPGSVVTLTVNFSETVNVDITDGTPSLALNDGGHAAYTSGSGSNALVFTYTVGALGSAQNTPNLALVARNAFALNGASISDAAGNAAVLTAANGYNPAGTLHIDTTAPTVTKVVTSPTSGEETTGHTVRVTLDMSEKVSVAGSPTLLLNDDGTANCDPSHSSATALAFDYTVASGQVTTDLVVSGIKLASPSAIADRAGNAANLAGTGANLGLQINTKSTGAAGPSGGNFAITGTTDLQLFGSSNANVTSEAGSTATLTLDASTQFAGTVADLAPGNSLGLSDIGFGAGSTLGYAPNNSNAGGVLTDSDGAHAAKIALLGQYIAASFVSGSDGHGGTLISDPPQILHPQLSLPHG